MTNFTITAVTNDRAQLIVHTTTTTDVKAANLVANLWQAAGHKILTTKTEG